jgi:ATP-dependent Clp protease ATP-binding subunit ClpC
VAKDAKPPDLLERDGRELTADRAAALPKTYGRKEEVFALARALGGKKSVVLLGPPGVGKTAIVKKLLFYLHDDRLPELAGAKVFEISTVGLCADTRYTGMQEDKIKLLLASARADRLVYIPDLWNVTQAGSYETNPRGIYDLMRPGIESGQLVVFGEMSAGRWEKLCREHPVLERDFATITVAPTSEEETRDVLVRTAGDLGHEAVFEKAAIERAYQLARKFLPTLSFPGKGVELLRSLAHEARIAAGAGRAAPIDVERVETRFGERTGLPMHMISTRTTVGYEQMVDFLDERVLGQESAVRAVADVLALYKTGLSNPDRPAGVLLFVGPTGVGKTELAKATAEFLFGSRERIFRVDLSEYKDFHSFEKLIGDPKSNKTGLLTDHVRQNPFTVVLLDEFEKGHPNLADLFLQVFDDARLTDATGETVGFHHALVIMTSNVGGAVEASGIGFARGGEDEGHGRREQLSRRLEGAVRRGLEAHYRPEFLNRIDRVLVMQPLAREDLRRIARRELGKVYRREGLLERDLLLEVDDGVIDLLLDRGTDPKYGARPLKRAIEETLVVPLARALLGAGWRRFQLLRAAREDDEVRLTFEETDASRRLEKLERRSPLPDGDGGLVHLSLADVRHGVKSLYQRLAVLEREIDLPRLRAELAAIEARQASPAFWEEAFGAGGQLVRRHRLSAEIGRLDDLRREVDLVHELAEASFAEADDAVAPDLVTAYARLVRDLARAELEIRDMDDVDQGDAALRVAPAGEKDSVGWARQLADMYVAWARERGYDVEIEEQAGGVQQLIVLGPYALGYLRGEAGTHRLLAPPPDRKERRGEALLAKVEVGSTRDLAGPNGSPELRKGDEPPIRTYDTWRSHGVRDRRTGHAEGDARGVLAGRLEGFLEAALSLRARDQRASSPPAPPSVET